MGSHRKISCFWLSTRRACPEHAFLCLLVKAYMQTKKTKRKERNDGKTTKEGGWHTAAVHFICTIPLVIWVAISCTSWVPTGNRQ
jgi:hypothetical protein